MDRLSLKLVREQREALLREKNGVAIGKEAIQTRDLLSLLIKANMASDIPESQKMSEEEVLGRKSPATRMTTTADCQLQKFLLS